MYYQNARISKDIEGKRYLNSISNLPPNIPVSESDIIIELGVADRFDDLANRYYGDSGMYKAIILANELPGDSLYGEPGQLIRIPDITTEDFLSILESYNFNK